MVAEPGKTMETRPSVDQSEEDAALALLNVSKVTILAGDGAPRGALDKAIPNERNTGSAAPRPTRQSSRRPKPVKRHKNDVGGFEKKDYSQFGHGAGRGRGRSGRGPGRPPKSSYGEFAGRGGMPPAYDYHYPSMYPHYAPEYGTEYEHQYPPHFARMGGVLPGGPVGPPGPSGRGIPPAMQRFGTPGSLSQPYTQQYVSPLAGVPSMMPHSMPPQGLSAMQMPTPSPTMDPWMMPQAMPPYHAPRPTLPPNMAIQAPAQPMPPMDGPYNPDETIEHVEKDIGWMQKHLDKAVGIIGRKSGEPQEFDTVGPNRKMESAYDPEIAKKSVVDLSDYTQEQLQDMADLTVQEACLPPVLQPRPGVRVSRTAHYTGSNEFYAGKIYTDVENGPGGAGVPDGDSVPPPVIPPSGTSGTPTAAAWVPPGAFQPPAISSGSLALQISKKWVHDNVAVWRLLGLEAPPVVEGLQINYLRLILVVRSAGGQQKVTGNQLWGDVASKFGLHSNAVTRERSGEAFEMLYRQYVQPIWNELQPFLPDLGAVHPKETDR